MNHLLILYEPLCTFPEKVAVRADTCVLAAISLNIQRRVYPIICTAAAGGLPFDCLQLSPLGECACCCWSDVTDRESLCMPLFMLFILFQLVGVTVVDIKEIGENPSPKRLHYFPEDIACSKNFAVAVVSCYLPITFSQRGIRPLIFTGKRNAATAWHAATTTAAPVMSPRIHFSVGQSFKQRPPQSFANNANVGSVGRDRNGATGNNSGSAGSSTKSSTSSGTTTAEDSAKIPNQIRKFRKLWALQLNVYKKNWPKSHWIHLLIVVPSRQQKRGLHLINLSSDVKI
uniref:Uncharacterized protein n=1 Tax=Glossina palpalis gambiensis TaxID=67801 RepID=A0A1B0BIN3_9MUSC